MVCTSRRRSGQEDCSEENDLFSTMIGRSHPFIQIHPPCDRFFRHRIYGIVTTRIAVATRTARQRCGRIVQAGVAPEDRRFEQSPVTDPMTRQCLRRGSRG